jgi:hypothetical protein
MTPWILGAANVSALAEDASPKALETAPGLDLRKGSGLDLRKGDLRRFIPPEQLYEPWTSELDEIVVQSRRQAPPDIPENRAVPSGLAGLVWAAQQPTQTWRLLVPDPRAPEVGPPNDPDAPREPPGAYRSRIGEPGRIF